MTAPDPEKAVKARYAAQMMAAVAVLAETAPDDFRRRIVGRSLFVYCHEFVRWARQAMNGLRKAGGQRDRIERLDPMLAQLAKADWGPYEEIRHRVAAHRQPLGAAVGDEAWTDINEVSLRVLSEDARAIWNELADGYRMPQLKDYPPLSPALEQQISEHGYEAEQPGLLAGLGSFDGTRPDAMTVTQGGELGDVLRRCVDSIRSTQILSQLFTAVNGHPPFAQAVAAAAHAEAVTLYDVVLAGPSTSKHHTPSLLEHLSTEDRASPGLTVLQNAERTFPHDSLTRTRTIRNRVAAHIDDTMPLHDLERLLIGYDANDVNAVVDALFAALTAAGDVDVLLRPVLLGSARLAGLSRVDPPEQGSPFSA